MREQRASVRQSMEETLLWVKRRAVQEGLMVVVCCQIIVFCAILAFGLESIVLLVIAVAASLWLMVFFVLRVRELRRSPKLEEAFASLSQAIDDSSQQIQEAEFQQQQEKLNALQSQINPHFLYNTLDTLRGCAVENGCFELCDMIAALSSMFKYSIEYENTMVSVLDERQHAEKYIQLQQMRFPGRFEYVETVDCCDKDLIFTMTPKMILQPIVENAIAHGLKHKASGGRIEVRYQVYDTLMEIIVSDNGQGMSDEQVRKINDGFLHPGPEPTRPASGGGIALPNIHARIQAHCGNAYGLRVVSTAGYGAAVHITLPALRE